MNAYQPLPKYKAWVAPSPHEFTLRRPTLPAADTLFRKRSVVGREGQPIPMHVYVPPAEGDVLYSLVRFFAPTHSLEVGLANGISALYIAKGLQDNATGRHIAIDPFQQQDWHEAGLVTLENAGLSDWVTVEHSPAHWVLPRLEQAGHKIQFAFIDGSHLFDYVMSDFLGVDRILEVGGVMAFDDADWPAVSRAIRFAITNRHYEVFDVGTVIEPHPIRPRWISRCLRRLAGWSPSVRRILRPEFVQPAHAMGMSGRSVALKKTSDDARDSQSQHMADF